MNEEGVKGFWYASPVFDLVQERKSSLPVVDTTANVFLLVIVRVHLHALRKQIWFNEDYVKSLSIVLNREILLFPNISIKAKSKIKIQR